MVRQFIQQETITSRRRGNVVIGENKVHGSNKQIITILLKLLLTILSNIWKSNTDILHLKQNLLYDHMQRQLFITLKYEWENKVNIYHLPSTENRD